MRVRRVLLCMQLLFLALFIGCTPEENSGLQLEPGYLSFHLEAGYDDVVGFLFRVENDEGMVAQRYVELEEEHFPSHLHEGTGPGHRFADAYFVLQPGLYMVSVYPMKSENEPSEDCAPARKMAEVFEQQTTEVILVSRCDMEDNGGLDVIVITNHDPIITDLIYRPSKFVLTCESVWIRIMAEDPDGDALSYSWEVVSHAEGAIYTLEAQQALLQFTSRTAGDYELKATVCDDVAEGHLCSEITFPIHVSMSRDEDGNGIGDECDSYDVLWTEDNDFGQGEEENAKYEDGAVWIDDFDILETPYLWVPSSNANQVALFDTNTLQLLNNSPFNCCRNPSRLGQDVEGNVFVTCRQDGRAMKMSLTGQVLWDTNLSQQCGPALRGAVYIPRVGEPNRLYVGCSYQGKTFILNAENGALLQTIATSQVYGLATDGQRVYISGRYNNTVQAIDIQSNQLAWTYQGIRPYGIAAKDGKVWLSSCMEGLAVSLDAATGVELARIRYPYGACGRGVAISSIDGMVYHAISDTNRVAKINPMDDSITDFPAVVSHSLGVDVDGLNRLFVIGYASSTVARMNNDGSDAQVFGQGALVNPYAYSSDLTGASTQFLETSAEWISNAIDLTNAGAFPGGSSITDIHYELQQPLATEVIVNYMVDDNGSWLPAPNDSGVPGMHTEIRFKVKLRSLAQDVSPALLELRFTYQPW